MVKNTETKRDQQSLNDESELVQVIDPIIKNNDLEPEEKTRAVVQIIKQESFSGPIPPPQILKGYNDLVPDAAERILRMAEKQSEHRMELERKVIAEQQRQSARGQKIAAVLSVLLIVAAVYAIYEGAYKIAGTIFAVTLIMVVGMFVGQGRIRKDLRDKQQMGKED